jgi:hypothetical protein
MEGPKDSMNDGRGRRNQGIGAWAWPANGRPMAGGQPMTGGQPMDDDDRRSMTDGQ